MKFTLTRPILQMSNLKPRGLKLFAQVHTCIRKVQRPRLNSNKSDAKVSTTTHNTYAIWSHDLSIYLVNNCGVVCSKTVPSLPPLGIFSCGTGWNYAASLGNERSLLRAGWWNPLSEGDSRRKFCYLYHRPRFSIQNIQRNPINQYIKD